MREVENIDGDGESTEPEEPIDDETELVEQFVPPWQRRQQPGAQEPAEKTLTNEEPIPLLPGAKKKTGREAIGVKVYKLDPPNHGYKGEIPISADEAYVASLHGDGTYNFEFFNDRRQVIRKREGVRISTGFSPDADKGARPVSELIDSKRMDLQRDAQTEARIDRVQREILSKTTELAQKHTDLVMKLASETSAREQTFFQTMLTTVQSNADAALERSREQHRQDMERIEAQHRMDIERERATSERMAAASDPNNVLKLIQRGMEMAGDQTGEPEEPWVKGMAHGVEGLKHLRDLALVTRGKKLGPPGKDGMRRRVLTTGAATGGTPPKELPREQNASAPPTKTREMARNVARLARECAKRGMDFDAVLRNAIAGVDASSESEHSTVGEHNDGEASPEGGVAENDS